MVCLDAYTRHYRQAPPLAIGLHGLTCHFPDAMNPRVWKIQRRELPDGFEIGLPLIAAGLTMTPDLSPGVLFGDKAEGVTLDVEQLQGLYSFVRSEVLPQFAHFFT